MYSANASSTMTAMTIYNEGVVSIGVSTADMGAAAGNYQLYVGKGILTEHIRVALKGSSGWSDYVFDPDYKLRPIQELNTYINENHHLPNIPSAAEVVKEGIDLGQMDSKLLAKIEELTLYIIQMQKEIDGLNKKMQTQSK